MSKRYTVSDSSVPETYDVSCGLSIIAKSIPWKRDAITVAKALNDRDRLAAQVATLREALRPMVQAMVDYQIEVDEIAPYRHRQMMDKARAALADTETPG